MKTTTLQGPHSSPPCSSENEVLRQIWKVNKSKQEYLTPGLSQQTSWRQGLTVHQHQQEGKNPNANQLKPSTAPHCFGALAAKCFSGEVPPPKGQPYAHRNGGLQERWLAAQVLPTSSASPNLAVGSLLLLSEQGRTWFWPNWRAGSTTALPPPRPQPQVTLGPLFYLHTRAGGANPPPWQLFPSPLNAG